MTKILKAAATLSVITFTSFAMANPKCSHRVVSSTNDLFKNTNPVKVQVAKNTTQAGQSKLKSGVR